MIRGRLEELVGLLHSSSCHIAIAADCHPIAAARVLRLVDMVDIEARLSFGRIQTLNAWHQLVIALIVLPNSTIGSLNDVALSFCIIVGALGT